MIKPLLAGLFGGLFCAGAIQADDLQAIRDLKLENGRILSVKRITRPYHIDKQDRKIGRVPSRIIVKLVLMPAKGSCINVEIWLPERDKWNGRFVGRGNGGAGGHINPDGFIGSIRSWRWSIRDVRRSGSGATMWTRAAGTTSLPPIC